MIDFNILNIKYVHTVEPRDKPKCPSHRGVRLIEVSQNFYVTVYMTL